MQESIRQLMQETLYQTTDARDSISENRCRSLYIRQRMQESFYHFPIGILVQVWYLIVSIPDLCTLTDFYFLLDSGCRSLYIRQPMQETLYNRQWMKKSLYLTADARDSLSDSRCKRLYIRQQMQQSLYQTADASDSI